MWKAILPMDTKSGNTSFISLVTSSLMALRVDSCFEILLCRSSLRALASRSSFSNLWIQELTSISSASCFCLVCWSGFSLGILQARLYLKGKSHSGYGMYFSKAKDAFGKGGNFGKGGSIWGSFNKKETMGMP